MLTLQRSHALTLQRSNVFSVLTFLAFPREYLPSALIFLTISHIMALNQVRANITSVLDEKRVFPPPKEFSKNAHIKSLAQYRKRYQESIRAPEKFWAGAAKNELVWFKPWTKVFPAHEWIPGKACDIGPGILC